MKVDRLYRRQWEGSKEEILRDICEVVGYRGRYVWLVETSAIDPRGPATSKLSKIVYRKVMLKPRPEVVEWKKEEDGKIHIDQSAIVIASPTLDKRRRTVFMFMHPTLAHTYQWTKTSAMSVMPEEYAVLMGETNSMSLQTAEVAMTVCLHRGLITAQGKLTGDGAEVLQWYSSHRQLSRS